MPEAQGLESEKRSSRRTRRDDQALALYRLAYEESQRTLDDQTSEFDTVRQRAVQYVAFVGTATAFLVGTGLSSIHRSTPFYVLAGIGTGLWAINLVLLYFVLMPTRLGKGASGGENKKVGQVDGRGLVPWNNRYTGGKLLARIEVDVPPPNEVDFLRAMTISLDKMRAQNDETLQLTRRRYVTFVLLGIVQLATWAAVAWIFGGMPPT